MKRKATSIALVFVACFTLAAYSFLPDYLTGKMKKHVVKIFGSEISYSEHPIADSLAINHQLFNVLKGDSLIGYSIISRALGCQIGGCDKPQSDSIAFEQFFFMTAFDAEKHIKKVRILEYTSDHGYQIANKGWLRQFEEGEYFEVGKNVDAISGATISVNSITKEVNNQLQILQAN